MPGSGKLRYDPRELRRMIAMSFSAGELSKYAERWRVFTDREGSSDEGARTLVKALETRDKLDALVDSLRAHKPLVEWPEPTLPALSAGASLADGSAPPASSGPFRAPHSGWADADGAAAKAAGDLDEGAPGASAQGARDEALPSPPPPRSAAAPLSARSAGSSSAFGPGSSRAPANYGGGAPSSGGRAEASARAEGALIDPYLARAAEEQAARRSRAPVWLPFAAVALVAAIGGASVMYLLRPAETPAPEPTATGVALLASKHLSDRVEAVAAACEAEGGAGDSARTVLSRAFSQCGLPEIRPGKLGPPPPEPIPTAPPRGQRPAAGKPPGVTSTPSCLDDCHKEFNACSSRTCGEEPTSASDYDDYQRCVGGCQSKYVRCRLICH